MQTIFEEPKLNYTVTPTWRYRQKPQRVALSEHEGSVSDGSQRDSASQKTKEVKNPDTKGKL